MELEIGPNTLALILIGVLLGGLTFNALSPFQQDDGNSDFTKVGVIDSGCSENQKSFVKEYNSFTTTQYGFFIEDDNIYDNLNHGTVVCDLIHRNSPNSVLYSARIANFKGELTFQSILAAVTWLVEEKEVDIINLSLGSPPYISELIDQIFTKYQNDTILVASSGNGGTNKYDDAGYIEWPAVYPWAIGVGSYSHLDSSLEADYTVGGLSYTGEFVTEYLDNGLESGKTGSSFAAPRISGKLAQLLYILRQEGKDPTLNELQGIFSTLTVGWQKQSFDAKSGWGRVDFDLLQSGVSEKLEILDQTTIFHAASETDVHSRFSDETWSRSWKFSTIGFDDEDIIDLSISGNGSNFVDDIQLDINPWGGILKINFKSLNQTGLYSINLSSKLGNDFEYSFNVLPPSDGKILMDHRSSVNGYGHAYAEFSNFEEFMRSKGYIVHHKLITESDYDYSEYRAVIVPRFAELQTVQNLTITRTLSVNLLDSYQQYVLEGGSLILLADLSDYTNVNQAQQYLSTYSGDYTGFDIGEYAQSPILCCPESISNFTTEIIATGVDELSYIGGEIRSSDENATELGWAKITSAFGIGFEYLSIGIFGNMGIGDYLILGGTSIITNLYFENSPSIDFTLIFDNFING